ncbi:MAG: BatD family protein [Saprospiraceae bacterium]
MKIQITIFFLFFSLMAFAQEATFSVIVPDTVPTNQQFRIEFRLDNAETQSQFEIPEIQSIKILSGPNISSSYMFDSGVSSKSMTYTYIAIADTEDQIRIPVQVIETDKGLLTAEAKILEAVEGFKPKRNQRKNPLDSFFGRDLFESDVSPIFPEKEEIEKQRKKNKRKVYRI